jgi:hypothetical protein
VAAVTILAANGVTGDGVIDDKADDRAWILCSTEVKGKTASAAGIVAVDEILHNDSSTGDDVDSTARPEGLVIADGVVLDDGIAAPDRDTCTATATGIFFAGLSIVFNDVAEDRRRQEDAAGCLLRCALYPDCGAAGECTLGVRVVRVVDVVVLDERGADVGMNAAAEIVREDVIENGRG